VFFCKNIRRATLLYRTPRWIIYCTGSTENVFIFIQSLGAVQFQPNYQNGIAQTDRFWKRRHHLSLKSEGMNMDEFVIQND